jgi:hypothetical protein
LLDDRRFWDTLQSICRILIGFVLDEVHPPKLSCS